MTPLDRRTFLGRSSLAGLAALAAGPLTTFVAQANNDDQSPEATAADFLTPATLKAI
jgi:hypothetical protein